jgi:molybdopterin synthase catalytic subunit
MIQITDRPIDLAGVLESVCGPAAGGLVMFVGTAREVTDGRRTASLEYQAYGAMAAKQLAELESQARAKWPIVEVAIVHRVGRVELAEASVAIAVSTPHRRDAFLAAEWLIDTLKQVVPIWKKENWADGSSQWVHPGM